MAQRKSPAAVLWFLVTASEAQIFGWCGLQLSLRTAQLEDNPPVAIHVSSPLSALCPLFFLLSVCG